MWEQVWCLKASLITIGLHRSVCKEDILKYKCMHLTLSDKVLKEKTSEVCVIGMCQLMADILLYRQDVTLTHLPVLLILKI